MTNRHKQLARWRARKTLCEEMIVIIERAMEKEQGQASSKERIKAEKLALQAWNGKNPVFFKCASCQRASPRGPSKRDAWMLAVEEGWFMNGSMAKFCQHCKVIDPSFIASRRAESFDTLSL